MGNGHNPYFDYNPDTNQVTLLGTTWGPKGGATGTESEEAERT